MKGNTGWFPAVGGVVTVIDLDPSVLERRKFDFFANGENSFVTVEVLSETQLPHEVRRIMKPSV